MILVQTALASLSLVSAFLLAGRGLLSAGSDFLAGDARLELSRLSIVMDRGSPDWVDAGFALTILCALWMLMFQHSVRHLTSWVAAILLKESNAANRDSLTGIANRRHFEASLDAALRHARMSGGTVALFSIDLGGIKRINDRMGHSAGDLLLKRIAQKLGAALDSTEFLSRVGGDEFTVIQPLAPGKRSSEDLARRLLDALRVAFDSAGSGIERAASIGISRYPADGGNADQLLRNAEAAMYHAKRTGSGCCFFDSSMRDAMRKQEIRKQLPSALERGEFLAHFQPIEDLSNGSIVRFEALCRWNNPLLGSVSPTEFIAIAEETGDIHAIGRWMLYEACLQGCRWQINGQSPVRLAVNVSAVQLSANDFVESVKGVLAATGFPAHMLELELTETALVSEPEESIPKMRQLRDLGVDLSMDDFGMGYSSLSRLQNMPVVAFKIDRSFTAEVDSSPTVVTMIASMIAMAHTLGLRVVTEGVESARQLEIVRQLGSDEVQGFLIGEPGTAETTLRLLAHAPSH